MATGRQWEPFTRKALCICGGLAVLGFIVGSLLNSLF